MFSELLRAQISTHAPRTGSDGLGVTGFLLSKDFNPRSPHGERRQTDDGATTSIRHFNPRSPHGERHNASITAATLVVFQPTLPARGATASTSSSTHGSVYFNPRSPHGERRATSAK